MPIHYVKGDATQPIGCGVKIIVHVCNDIGGWGRGFVLAVSKRWKQPEAEYRKWFAEQNFEESEILHCEPSQNGTTIYNAQFGLGNVQFVKVENDIWLGNMIAQRDIYTSNEGVPPIRYSALNECLGKVARYSQQINASVHMPRIGCGLAGGEWSEVEALVMSNLINNTIDVTVYDLE